jgi:dipeptidyl aminopeptidase/acylaminoacyl peptidase
VGGSFQFTRRNRAANTVTPIGQLQRLGHWFDLSPDGSRLVFDVDDSENAQIWSIDLARGTQTRLTFDRQSHSIPAWSPDGRAIAYVSGRETAAFTITLQTADGTGPPREVAKGWGPAFTPDGQTIVYTALHRETSWDIWAVSIVPGATPTPVLQEPAWQYYAQVSPDGRTMAYISRETGEDEVYLKRFPSGEGKWQVSVRGGCWPRWSRGGDRLYYIVGDDVMEVDVQLASSIMLGQPRVVFTREAFGVDTINSWPTHFTVSPDGADFYFIQNVDRRAGRSAITVVQNWFAEFQPSR